uniref:Peptidase S8 n=1 Tax=Thermosporothrix sp. COM3 TaxID=2490863 RepID=A0A455SEN4_9CHLR|nr:peptidase S8 [Thermosporothrix sp. COM3]
MQSKYYRTLLPLALLLAACLFLSSPLLDVQGIGPAKNYILVFQPQQQTLPQTVISRGHTVVYDLSAAGVMVVRTHIPDDLMHIPGIISVAPDRPHITIPAKPAKPLTSGLLHPLQVSSKAEGCASNEAVCPQQWDLERIHVPQAWEKTRGSRKVRVAVLDSGLTSTHEALGDNYDKEASKSFVEPTNCAQDSDVNSLEDFNGHGTWTALHIAGKNTSRMSGIAPETTLINLRVLNACGIGTDSWILAALMHAHKVGAQIVSMSLGGFVCADGVVKESYYCRTEKDARDGASTWKAYNQTISYLLQHGTLVVASAGNEHVQLDQNGRVMGKSSVGFGAEKNDPSNNLYGLREIPAGIPGVLTVSATNRITQTAQAGETRHGQYGQGLRDQLAYYSNYGARIDVSAPGGSRNYNVPRFDCISTRCDGLTPSSSGGDDHTGVFGAFGIDEKGQLCSNCYSYLQGTSMAAPTVSGVAALVLARHPGMSVQELTKLLKRSVTPFLDKNATPPAASNSKSPYYNYTIDYDAAPISNRLMGTGIIDAARAVS